MIYENFLDKQKIDRELHWWVQAENVVGHINLYQHFGDTEALDTAARCWEFIKTKLGVHQDETDRPRTRRMALEPPARRHRKPSR